MSRKNLDIESTAQAYLALLKDRGIDYLFANAGTDFAPLIDAFARAAADGTNSPAPVPVTVPHENAAVSMAHGYYLITGKPQAVMVHVTVGTANAMNGIINAAREHIPILFTAGRTPVVESGVYGSRDLYIHWAQESFDQAAMVREYVKWDYELRNFDQLEAVVDRALEIAMTPPCGPVYLTLPREVLGQKQSRFSWNSPPRRHIAEPAVPSESAVHAAAGILAQAEHPLIITSSSGRTPESVRQLVRLAETGAIPVIAFNPRYMCFPTDHPLHLGFDPKPFLKEADAILVLESDVPWYPSVASPNADCKIIHIGVDPAFSRYPVRSFPSDLSLQGDPAATLSMLSDALAPMCHKKQESVNVRFGKIAEMHKAQARKHLEIAENARNESPLSPLWISRCIHQIKDEKTIIFNEYDLTLSQVSFDRPGSFFANSAAGGLGWGLGASIGAALAAPDHLVIATLGDGSYMFGNPTPCHFVARASGIPTLTIIYNNGLWNAVKSSNLRMYPDGWTAKNGKFPLSEIEPSPAYEMLVQACGGYGERVETASEVLPALERAVRVVREERRPALLNMICKK